jgi:hypothetical protein
MSGWPRSFHRRSICTKGGAALFRKIGRSGRLADPSTEALRSPGRDDKERVVAYLENCDRDVWIFQVGEKSYFPAIVSG